MLYLLFCYTIATVILYVINSVFFTAAWLRQRQSYLLWFAVMFAAYVVEITLLLAGDLFAPVSDSMLAHVLFRACYCYIYCKLALCLVKCPLKLWQELALGVLSFSAVAAAAAFKAAAELFCAAAPMAVEMGVGGLCLYLLGRRKGELSYWEYCLSMAFSVILVIFAGMVGVERISKALLSIELERNFSSELFGLAHIVLGFTVLLQPYRMSRRRTEISPELAAHYGLTRREVEVANMLFKGSSNQEICDALYISQGTVKAHVHNIYQKLDVQSRSQFMAVLNKGRPMNGK